MMNINKSGSLPSIQALADAAVAIGIPEGNIKFYLEGFNSLADISDTHYKNHISDAWTVYCKKLNTDCEVCEV